MAEEEYEEEGGGAGEEEEVYAALWGTGGCRPPNAGSGRGAALHAVSGTASPPLHPAARPPLRPPPEG